jgi:uncharacterized protein with NRDE domain
VCTLAIYVRQFPGVPVVVAANRDEFLERPATVPVVLLARPRIVGGRDLQAGGTWLGISERGIVAGLLNRRTAEPPVSSKRSRGLLLMEVLASASVAAAEHALAAVDPEAYNAFNLLVADRTHAVVAQNRAGGTRLTTLDAGVHVLSNLDVNDPTCPKIARSHGLFAAAGDGFGADGDQRRFRGALRRILADHTTALDPRQPDTLGALCVHAEGFGTRCSSLLFLEASGRWRHWYADGPPCRADYAPALTP